MSPGSAEKRGNPRAPQPLETAAGGSSTQLEKANVTMNILLTEGGFSAKLRV